MKKALLAGVAVSFVMTATQNSFAGDPAAIFAKPLSVLISDKYIEPKNGERTSKVKAVISMLPMAALVGVFGPIGIAGAAAGVLPLVHCWGGEKFCKETKPVKLPADALKQTAFLTAELFYTPQGTPRDPKVKPALRIRAESPTPLCEDLDQVVYLNDENKDNDRFHIAKNNFVIFPEQDQSNFKTEAFFGGFMSEQLSFAQFLGQRYQMDLLRLTLKDQRIKFVSSAISDNEKQNSDKKHKSVCIWKLPTVTLLDRYVKNEATEKYEKLVEDIQFGSKHDQSTQRPDKSNPKPHKDTEQADTSTQSDDGSARKQDPKMYPIAARLTWAMDEVKNAYFYLPGEYGVQPTSSRLVCEGRKVTLEFLAEKSHGKGLWYKITSESLKASELKVGHGCELVMENGENWQKTRFEIAPMVSKYYFRSDDRERLVVEGFFGKRQLLGFGCARYADDKFEYPISNTLISAAEDQRDFSAPDRREGNFCKFQIVDEGYDGTPLRSKEYDILRR